MRYCPIARNFYRVRRVLVETLGLPRESIRPSSLLADLVPVEDRRRVWRRFRQERLDVPPLMPAPLQLVALLALLVGSFQLGCHVVGYGWQLCVGTTLAGVLATAALAWWWAIAIDPELTIGEAALRMTTAEDCREAGYCFTSNEIFLKVRQVLVDALNIDPEEITPETKLFDIIDD
jgi:hypothetical protein